MAVSRASSWLAGLLAGSHPWAGQIGTRLHLMSCISVAIACCSTAEVILLRKLRTQVANGRWCDSITHLQTAALTIVHSWQQGCQEDSGSEGYTQEPLTDAQEPRCRPAAHATAPHSQRGQARFRSCNRGSRQPRVFTTQVSEACAQTHSCQH